MGSDPRGLQQSDPDEWEILLSWDHHGQIRQILVAEDLDADAPNAVKLAYRIHYFHDEGWGIRWIQSATLERFGRPDFIDE